jgi:glycosyltransferase involved in cell wall biosynthesis
MKVILVGLPYFARNIARNLAKTDTTNCYLAIDASAGVWQKIRYVWHMISAKVLYQVGGSHIYGGTLRIAMLLSRKIVMHWVGTDVLNLREACKVGDVNTELIRRTIHLCEVDWIKEELIEVGVHAEIAQIACFAHEISVPPRLPEIFSILSYIGRGREKFYGIDKLIELARSFPDIPIRIVGIAEYSELLPSNIQLLGWVKNMATEYTDCVLYLRLPEHDGLAFSVLEALSYGRYVGYTYAFPCTNKTSDITALHDLVKLLSERYNMGLLDVNLKGYEILFKDFDVFAFSKVNL